MHYEFLVEDQSGKILLNELVPKLIDLQSTFTIHAYKGIGHIPKDLKSKSDPDKRILLDQLPRLLAGYGQAFPEEYQAVVFVICDLDKRDANSFLSELHQVTQTITRCPKTIFCLTIEEGEAWLLGDLNAVQQGYPKAKMAVLKNYVNDSICGTWELLADALYQGGAKALSKLGYHAIGQEKSLWAKNIGPHVNIEANQSPSFRYLVKNIHNASHS